MSAKVGPINWEDVKRRLETSQRALTATEVNLDAVYRARAAELARRGVEHEVATIALRVLVFALGTERYALEFADLVELLPFARCAPVPGAPPQLLGVVNVDGEIRSVVDLGRLLELPDRDSCVGGYILLVHKYDRQVGMRVDRIDRIQLLGPEELTAPPEGEAGLALKYLQALGPDRLRLLSTDALFAHALFQSGPQ
jgi:purine-binding chemotaxis protein CheW